MPHLYSLPAFQFSAREDLDEAIGLKPPTNFENRKYAVRRKPVPSPGIQPLDPDSSKNAFQGSVDPEIPASTLKKDYLELTSSALTFILPIPFYVLAFYIVHIEGKDTEGDWWQSLQTYMNASVTAFPIFFAVVAGRAAKKFAAWKLEDRASIGDLEQLMGSSSLGGTIASTFSLRLFNALTPVLLLIWILSPLGGQSSLHLATTQLRYTFRRVNITYYDTRSESVLAQSDIAIGQYMPTADAVFKASVMEPSSAMISVRDLWGNVKIPNLASLRTSDAMLSPSWTNITSENSFTYSSLLGIPLSGLPQSGRTTMTLETSYLTLVQDQGQGNFNLESNQNFNSTVVDNMDNGTWHWAAQEVAGLFMALDGFNAADGNYSLWYNIYDRYSSDTEFVHQAPRHLALRSSNYRFQRTYTLSTTYVETSISCDGQPNSCKATAIRISQQPHINRNISNLAYSDAWTSFTQSMSLAVATGESGVPSITEAYMNDPSTVAANSINFIGDFSNLTATDEQLQIRGQQLLNTYWQASVNPAITIVGLSNIANELQNLRTRSAEGIQEITTTVCKVNWAWWLAFTCATSVMLALAILTLTIDCTLRGPETLGYCSTLLRDSPYVTTSRGAGSTMGGAERARKWKDVMVKLTDVNAGEDVGYLAVTEVGKIGSLAMERWRKRLPKGGRLYA